MQLRISSCKKTVFRKNLTRFAPVWVGWLLFLSLILLTMSDDDMDFWFPSNIASSIQVMGIFTCGYALLTAQMLFGDLFSSRMCNALHAMPLKREHWYGVHVRSGLWFSLVPTTIVALVASIWLYLGSTMINGWQIPLYWWAGTNLSYLFFFGLAVFSVMCVGSRFAMAVVYGIFTFASVLVMFLVDSLYIPLLHGLITPTEVFILFCPVVHSTSLRFLNCTRVETGKEYPDAYGVLQKERIGQFTVYPEHWEYLLIIALLGILLLLIARVLYRHRHLECAGDFVASPALTPVFQVVMSLMVTSAFGALYAIFFGDSGMMGIYIAVGLAAGWFASKMFLARSTRVFAPKNWLGLVLLTAILAGSLYLTSLDPLGFETRIPRVRQVTSAEVQLTNYVISYGTEDPAEVADFLRIHELALKDRVTGEEVLAANHPDASEADAKYIPIYLEYTLDNGLTSRRRYYIAVDSEEGRLAKQYFSSEACILQNQSSLRQPGMKVDLLLLAGTPERLTIHGKNVPREYLTEEFLEELLTAIRADCEAGTMAQYDAFHDGLVVDTPQRQLHSFHIGFYLKDGRSLWLLVYPDSENTLAVLEKTGIPEMLRQDS